MNVHSLDKDQVARSERLQRILPLLACPICRGSLALASAKLICQSCGTVHPLKNGVPVLLPAGVQDAGAIGLSPTDRVSRHPYSERAEQIIAAHESGWVLDLGAGGKIDRRNNVVQIDIFRYPAVDVVGSADCLPFCDNAFDAVISQAVFEHLQYPEWAVKEIRRVLKPGGLAKIDTAFLQPEHGYPHHFYNATETGLLHWFRDFDIQWSGVEPFQHPKWALHWFLDVYLDYVGEAESRVLRNLTVGNLLDALQRHSVQQTIQADLAITQALDALPDHFLRVLAAGVSVHAINPPKHQIQLGLQSASPQATLDREREMAQLRTEKHLVQDRLNAFQEKLKAAQDKAEYLAQFYPSACNLAQFAAAWADPMHLLPIGAMSGESAEPEGLKPFVSIAVRPTSISAILDTFFSLVNQTFGGWELVLELDATSLAGIKKAAQAMCRLDERVRIIMQTNPSEPINVLDPSELRGDYWMRLGEGATFAIEALHEIVSVARNLPGVVRISFDFERKSPGELNYVRCYSQYVEGITGVESSSNSFDPSFNLNKEELPARTEIYGVPHEAHIPRSLVQLNHAQSESSESQSAAVTYLLEQYREVSDELQQLNVESPTAARELRQLNSDIASYLARYYFDSNVVVRRKLSQVGAVRWVRQALGRWVRDRIPVGILAAISRNPPPLFSVDGKHAELPETIPFVSLVLEPESALALIATFFSLVHQTYTGWELLLIENDHQSPAVRRAIRDFCKLDKRVAVTRIERLAGKNQERHTSCQSLGRYGIELIDGVTLTFNALEQVVTLAMASPGTQRIACDFDHITQSDRLPMRCYNFPPLQSEARVANGRFFDGVFVLSKDSSFSDPGKQASEFVAHLPHCLFHLSIPSDRTGK